MKQEIYNRSDLKSFYNSKCWQEKKWEKTRIKPQRNVEDELITQSPLTRIPFVHHNLSFSPQLSANNITAPAELHLQQLTQKTLLLNQTCTNT